MALVLAGVVRLLVGDPVDRDQGAVQDRVRQLADALLGGGQVVATALSSMIDSCT